jgi:dipeptide transport system permease protein
VTPLLKKLATLIPTLIGVTLVAFFMIRLIPGDPIEIMVGERRLDPVAHAALMAKLGLDQPLVVQYFRYVGELLQGNLGTSIVTREPVLGEFLVLFPATIELAFAALLLAVVGGLALGVAAALKRGSWLDQAVMALATVGNSMPVFWWGLILIMFFSVGLEWTPVSGRVAIEYDIPFVTGFMLVDTLLSDEPGSWRSAVLHLALPATVLGTIPMAVVARMTRSSMLEVLREDYMRTARAKGLPPGRIVVVHGLRNALIPVLTVLGLQVGGLLGGAVLTETIFSWPGIGKLIIDSIQTLDRPVMVAYLMLVALLFIVINLIVDLSYAALDPRLRIRRTA